MSFAKHPSGGTGLGYDGPPITPSDAHNTQDNGVDVIGYLLVAVGGTIMIDVPDLRDTSKLLRTNVQYTVPAGLFPIPISKLYATGTGATGFTLVLN